MTKRKQASQPDPLDYRKQILNIAQTLGNNEDLSPTQRAYLVLAFHDIANGGDANIALRVKFLRGQSEKDALLRRNMFMIMHMIAGLIAPATDFELEGPPVTLIDACEMLSPIARRLSGDANKADYDAAYLLKYWNENKHLHYIWRTVNEPGSPYENVDRVTTNTPNQSSGVIFISF